MVKQKKKNALKYPVFWLLLSAFLIELINIIVTWSLGMAQKDTCPKSSFPGDLSIFLGIGSLALIVILVIIAKNKITAVALLLFWAISIVLIGYFLQFAAVGGLNWCNVRW